MITLGTGESTAGHGGDVRLVVGKGTSGDGGDIILTAGETTRKEQKGGSVVVTAGMGSSDHFANGGDGGHVHVHGGIAKGKAAL